MTMSLKDLDELWDTPNLDEKNMKYLCRKYSPKLILEWINRGLTINNKEIVIDWYKLKLEELGEKVIPQPEEVEDDKLFNESYGDYFSE